MTETDANRPSKSPVPWIIAAVVLVGAVGAGGGFLYLKHKKDVLASQQVTTPPVVPVIPHGSIAIDSDPQGASIWINGDLRAEVTPTKISDLPIGSSIEVKLTKDGFEQAKETITLTELKSRREGFGEKWWPGRFRSTSTCCHQLPQNQRCF